MANYYLDFKMGGCVLQTVLGALGKIKDSWDLLLASFSSHITVTSSFPEQKIKMLFHIVMFFSHKC